MEELFYVFLVLALLAIPIGFIVLIIVYIGKTNSLSKRLQDLEWQVTTLSGPAKRAQQEQSSGEQTQPAYQPLREAPAHSPTAIPPVSARPTASEPTPAIGVSQPAAPTPPVVQQPAAPIRFTKPPSDAATSAASPPPLDRPIATKPQMDSLSFERPRPARSRADWESLIGGRLMNWIGALALIIGAGFFLRHAFQQNWIPPWGRVSIGYAAGVALLVMAARFNKKGLAAFSQGLLGAGISILYLSAYATFNRYGLVTQTGAFLIMSAITALTFIIGIKYGSLAVAFLGWLGGFLTPQILSTGAASEVGLFTYITLLDVGLIAVLIVKDRWVVLEPLTVGATYVYYMLWYSHFYREPDLPITVVFLTVFWVLFYALDVSRTVRPAESFNEVRQVTAAFNGVFYYAAMYSIINQLHHDVMGWITLTIGLVYFLTAMAASRVKKNDPLTFARNILTAVILMVLATGIQFTGFTTVIYWSVEAGILVWCGLRWNLKYVWGAALALLAITLGKLIFTEGAFALAPEAGFKLLWNLRAAAFATLAGSAGLSAHLFGRAEDRGAIRSLLHYIWGILAFALITVETNDHFKRLTAASQEGNTPGWSFIQWMTMSLVWLFYSLPMVWSGLRARLQPLINCGLTALALAVWAGLMRGAVFEPIEHFSLLFNYRAAGILILMSGLAAHGFWLKKRREGNEWVPIAIGGLLIAWCASLFVLCTAETHDEFRSLKNGVTDETDRTLSFMEPMTLAAVWTVYSAPLVWAGLKKKLTPVLIIGLLASALAVIVSGVRSFFFDPIQTFILIFNYRMGAVLIVIAGLIIIERMVRSVHDRGKWMDVLLLVARMTIPLLILTLATAETNDYFNKEIDELLGGPSPGETALTAVVDMKQMTLSLVWLVFSIAIILYGIWRRQASLRILAIIVFGVSIAKIFFYDLRFLETLYRIFSFMGLGVILLAVSYVYNRFKDFIFPPSTQQKPPPAGDAQ